LTIYLPVWHSDRTSARFTVLVPCIDELTVHSCFLLCLQRQVAKATNGLFYCWSLLRNNNMATNLQRFTSCYGSRRFACMCLLNADFLSGNATRQWQLIAVSHVHIYFVKRSMS